MQTLPEEFFVCANLQPDRKRVARGLAALWGCSAGDARSVMLALALGHGSSAISHPQISSHPTPQRNREQLPRTCERDRKCSLSTNVLTHNPCVQVGVLLTLPKNCQGLLFSPKDTKGVLGWCICDKRAQETLVLKTQAKL